MRIVIYIIFLTIVMTPEVFSQGVRKLNIIQANTLEGTDKGGQKIKKLIGDVILEHDGTYMYCDSAYNYESEDYFNAYGNVVIKQGDKFRLQGNFLNYNLRSKMAKVEQNVRLTDNEMTLTTGIIYYDMNNKIAWYPQGGIITDAENRMSSTRGYYHLNGRDMYFKNNVVLTNPDFKLTTDSLKYNLNSRRATFLAPTLIKGDESEIYCEEGWYETESKKTEFRKNAYVFSKERQFYGDILFYDVNTGDAWARGKVIMIDTLEKTRVSGNYSEKIEAINTTFITDSALFIKYMSNDTLHLHADTLFLIKDSSNDKDILKAYFHVSAISQGFSVRCDSLIYNNLDSMIWFYNDPVMWQEQNQITADLIILFTRNDEMDKMELHGNAFMSEKVDSLHFNQVKGRTMTGYFSDNRLDYIDTEGNAESVYYLMDDDNKFVGRNNIQSSYIRIIMGDEKIKEIKFIESPAGKVTPPKSMNNEEARLSGFSWREAERPNRIEDLFKHRTKTP